MTGKICYNKSKSYQPKRRKGKDMLGFYDYTVILTYISLITAVSGIAAAKLDHPLAAIFCLLFCGLCDMFDGKIARSKKNRTEDEKKFGIQIDSLCDLVCFGVLPAMICFEMMGERDYGGKLNNAIVWTAIGGVCGFYVLAGLIRLAFFNVTEESRQKKTDQVRSKYQGLPITTAALILPIIYIPRLFIEKNSRLDLYFCIFYTVVLLIVGILFITPFHVKKPKMKQMIAMLIGGIIIAIVLSVAYMIMHFVV